MKWICIKNYEWYVIGGIYETTHLPMWCRGQSDFYRDLHFMPYGKWLALERERKINELLND